MSEISIKTERLCLRPLREADLEAFAAYRSDPEVARYQSWDAPYSLDQANVFLTEMESAPAGVPGHWYQLGVERPAEPGIIGDVAFQVLAEDPLQAHIGVTFSRQHQKQGYASEAVAGLLGYLFGELNLHRVSAICDAENGSSARLLERVGMRREGHFIENVWFKGAWGSEFLYAILYDEWNQR
jgi:RimJ/RimL family protein N-acetyltransferase